MICVQLQSFNAYCRLQLVYSYFDTFVSKYAYGPAVA